MASYISSNHERLYARVEPSFGQTVAATNAHRFPAVRFTAQQQTERPFRRDKTGTRTQVSYPTQLRRRTSFEIQTYMTSWTNMGQLPPYSALFQAALGSAPRLISSRVLISGSTATTLQFGSSHGFVPGDGVVLGDEVRFVQSVPNTQSIVVNHPFSGPQLSGVTTGTTASFHPADDLPSLSVFSYRSPLTALQRFLTGAVIDQMSLVVNGDYHEFQFLGQAQDLFDDASFDSSDSVFENFPAEPALNETEQGIIPGHLGQAWLGGSASRFFTITDAEIQIDNQIDLRDREFGEEKVSGFIAGERRVSLQFSLFEKDDEATQSLYRSARNRTPISVMFQLGQKPGQMMGVWMKNVIPEIPDFDDRETRVQWRFRDSSAYGRKDDEIYVAFG